MGRSVILLLCAALASTATSSSPARADDGAAGPIVEKPSLLVMRFQASGVDRETVSTVEAITSDAFAKTERFRVLSMADLSELMDLESGKQAAGCTDSDCVAELAGAMGADLVVTGQLGRLGTLYVLKLTLLRPATATTHASESIEVERIELLAARVREVALEFAYRIDGKRVPPALKTAATPAPQPVAAVETSEGGAGPWVLLGGAGLAALGVGGLIGSVVATYVGATVVWDGASDGATKGFMRDSAPWVIYGAGGAGAVGLAVGVVALISGGVMWLVE